MIGQIKDDQLTIASAVEEQTATTNEMLRSVAEAAGGTMEIGANITGVSTAAGSTTQVLSQTRLAVDELSRMATDLAATCRDVRRRYQQSGHSQQTTASSLNRQESHACRTA